MSSTDSNEAEEKSSCKGIPAALKVHFSRVFTSRLNKIEPTEAEQSKLEATGSKSTVFQSYLAWRRSCFLVALLPLFIGFVSGWIRVSDASADPDETDDGFQGDDGYQVDDGTSRLLEGAENPEGEYQTYMLLLTTKPEDMYTFLGIIVFYQILPSLASTILLLTAAYCAYKWAKWGESSKGLRIAWLVTLVMPLVPALFPSNFLIKDSFEARMAAASQQTYKTLMGQLKIERTTTYSITILPILLTLPNGASKGALKIWGLLPQSNFASLVLLFMQPFSSIITLLSFVVILQLFGNVQMMIGTLLLTIAPSLYLLRRELYIGKATEENEKKVDCNGRIMTLLSVTGMLLILIKAFVPQEDGRALIGTSEENGHMVISDLITVVFETWGRGIITGVFFSDILVQMMVANGRQDVEEETVLLMESDMKIDEEEKEPGKMSILMNKTSSYVKSKMPKNDVKSPSKDNAEDGGSLESSGKTDSE